MKVLIVVDMQNDFIDGVLGTREAVAIVPHVKKKIEAYRAEKKTVIFTRDTHGEDYLLTQEGRKLPVDAECCAGVMPETHTTALKAMDLCQVEILHGHAGESEE